MAFGVAMHILGASLTVALAHDALPPLPMPGYPGIRSRFADLTAPEQGLRTHYLESGWKNSKLMVLLHGYPELAYSWRHIMEPVAAAGYHVVAPDVRGYGRTTGWDPSYDTSELHKFSTSNKANDTLALVKSLGYTKVDMVVGTDAGSGVAVECASLFPEVFASMVHMSAPHGTPSIFPLDALLQHLNPPRKHYMAYYATRGANGDMMNATQGLHDFIRAYNHIKSGDWNGTRGPHGDMPHHLDASLGMKAFAELPHYYVMLKSENMAETVAHEMPSAEEIAALSNHWLPEKELNVYAEEYGRTGFQGGLNGYRIAAVNLQASASSAKISVPSTFIGGAADWGVYQLPGSFESMPKYFTNWYGAHLVAGAGHWLPQENGKALVRLLLEFAQNVTSATAAVSV